MTDPLRILQLGPLPPPVGGMATVIEGLTDEQRKQHRVRVLNNVKTTPEDRALWQGVVAQLRLLSRLAWLCLSWRPEFVHIHTCSWGTFWRNAVDVLLARTLGRRVVLHIHGAEFHKFLASLSARRAALARRVFGLSHAVIVLGDQWAEIIAPWCPQGRVHVVPNGVPVPEQTASGAPDGLPVILCMANYERRKGQVDLISALAQMAQPSRLLLHGFESESGQRARLQAHADALGVADRVSLPGPVMGEAKQAAVMAADLFCLPSYDEGLPMSMLEAMAAGVAVVVTSVGAIPEALDANVDGIIVPPGDVEALTGALDGLLVDSDCRARIAAGGRARVIKDYSVARVARDLDAIYDALMKSA
ncbi:MAG: glycosyltransferase family 4 protein [Gammaproteobacteria bacterium]|nr:glycosyltransferase family 4 protein [Gammaproteobacteria bacterium]MCP5136110.1 glycosyltransferase family 4 protein [Gammaproteobacteria bacterium]